MDGRTDKVLRDGGLIMIEISYITHYYLPLLKVWYCEHDLHHRVHIAAVTKVNHTRVSWTVHGPELTT